MKITKKNRIREHADLNLLRHDECRAKFNLEIRNRDRARNVEELEQQPENIEQAWRTFKECIHESKKEVLPEKVRENKQEWMTKEILELMEERKQYKFVDLEKYKEIDKNIIREQETNG